jgi:nicotinamide mononucleotide transporter
MAMAEWLDILSHQAGQVTWLEWLSTVSQVASVYYAQRNNVWVYPTGITGVLAAAYLYFFIASPPLYAEGGVHMYYFFMSCYGWWIWTRKNTEQKFVYPISRTSRKEFIMAVVLWMVAWTILYLALRYATDSNTPWLDSLVSSTAITAMWLMAKRKIENWSFWILSNLVAIPLHVYKGFYLFALMFVLFLVMAVIGHRKWMSESGTGNAASR